MYLLYVQRKLLVEKRVVLDDIPNADRKSDRLLATLPPREPTIQRDEESPSRSKLRTSKSEYNMSRIKSSSLTHGAGLQPAQARLATSISVGSSLSTRTGHPAPAGHAARSDVVGSWKVHDINEIRDPQNANSSREPGRVQASTLARVNSAAASSSQHRTCGTAGVGRTRTDRNQHKRVSTNADNAQSVVHGTRPRSVPPKLSHQPLQAHGAQCDDSMGAQYEPGNVRHLVQTFQSAVRPVTTPGRGDTAVDQTTDADSGRTDDPQQMSTARDRLQTADRQFRRQTSGDTVQEKRWQSGQRNLQMIPPRTEANVNVCVVRPATGRTLPQPPTPDQSQSLTAGQPSEPATQELPNQPDKPDTRSSNKVGKLWQAYGCL